MQFILLNNVYLFFSIIQVSSTDEVSEVTSKMSSVQLDKVSASPTLKLPQLFSLTPNSSGKTGNMQKRQNLASQTSQIENSSESKSPDRASSNDHINNLPQGLLHPLSSFVSAG